MENDKNINALIFVGMKKKKRSVPIFVLSAAIHVGLRSRFLLILKMCIKYLQTDEYPVEVIQYPMEFQEENPFTLKYMLIKGHGI